MLWLQPFGLFCLFLKTNSKTRRKSQLFCQEVKRLVKIRVSYEEPEELEQVLSILKSSGNEPEIPVQEEAKHGRAYLDLKLGKGTTTENYSLELIKTYGSNEVRYFIKLHISYTVARTKGLSKT